MSITYILAKPEAFSGKVFFNTLADAGLPKILIEESRIGPTELHITYDDPLTFEQFTLLLDALTTHNPDFVSRREALALLHDLYSNVLDRMYVIDPQNNKWFCHNAAVVDILTAKAIASVDQSAVVVDYTGRPRSLSGAQLTGLQQLMYATIKQAMTNYATHYAAIAELTNAAGYDFTVGWPEYE